MEPLKTIGEEIKSNLQLILVLLASPIVIQYILWNYLPEIRDVSIGGEVSSALREMMRQYLLNTTSNSEFFANVASAQMSSLFNAVSKVHLILFLTGGLLAAFLISEPIYRGNIVNDIGLMGKRKTLTGRFLFIMIYALFLVASTGVIFWNIANLAGLSLESRFFLSLLVTSLLSLIAGSLLVTFLSTVSKEPVIPLAMLFIVGFLSMTTLNLNSLLLPFEKLTYFMWNPKGTKLTMYVRVGLALYAVLAVATVKSFEGGDFY